MEKLNKITLIIGPEDSGKSYLANQLMKAYSSPHFVNARVPEKSLLPSLRRIVKIPDVVVVDDLNRDLLELFYNVATDPFPFILMGQADPDPIFIPWIITSTMTADQLPKGPSFNNRFNVIDLTPLHKKSANPHQNIPEKFTAWALEFFHPEGENIAVRLIKEDIRLSFLKSTGTSRAQLSPMLFNGYLKSFFKEYGYQLNPHIRGNRCVEQINGLSTQVLYVIA